MSPLGGLRVWVTRPVHQAEQLCTAIEQAGGHALRQPLLAIAGPSDPETARKNLLAYEGANDLIFTSSNAVAGAWQLQPTFAPRARLAAIGKATATALEHAQGRTVIRPESGYTSEDLLAMPVFSNPNGRRIGIITGENGRGHIQSILVQRGATVAEITVYRREPVPLRHGRLYSLVNESDAIVITSGEALSHLATITPTTLMPTLKEKQLVVPSTRVLKLAGTLGFKLAPLRPERMDDAAQVDALARLT